MEPIIKTNLLNLVFKQLSKNFREKKCLVVFSGGQDSTTCLSLACQFYKEVYCLSFDYGQKHNEEIKQAQYISQNIFNVKKHEGLPLNSDILKGASPLTNKNEVLEEYEHYSKLPGGLEKTFVPGRNALFSVIASNRAYCLDNTLKNIDIMLGINQDDFGGYPDCTENFLVKQNEAINAMFGIKNVNLLVAPLLYLNKANICKLSLLLEKCYYALQFSRTSYAGEFPPIHKNHASLLREKGFVEANIPDPLFLYAKEKNLIKTFPKTDNYNIENLHKYYNLFKGETLCL